MECNIISRSTDLVGNNTTIKAEILENSNGFKRIKDTIIVDLINAAHLDDVDIKAQLLAIYTVERLT